MFSQNKQKKNILNPINFKIDVIFGKKWLVFSKFPEWKFFFYAIKINNQKLG